MLRFWFVINSFDPLLQCKGYVHGHYVNKTEKKQHITFRIDSSFGFIAPLEVAEKAFNDILYDMTVRCQLRFYWITWQRDRVVSWQLLIRVRKLAGYLSEILLKWDLIAFFWELSLNKIFQIICSAALSYMPQSSFWTKTIWAQQ